VDRPPVRVRPPGLPAVPPRALRAGLAAALAVVTACAAHSVGNGPVDAAGAAWAFVALIGPAWWLARRERGWAALALTQLGAQQVVHVALAAAADHAHHVGLGADLMLYAHLAAAALTGAWLRWGERRAWAAVRRYLLVTPVPVAVPATGPALAIEPREPARPTGARLLRHAVARRGPPLPA